MTRAFPLLVLALLAACGKSTHDQIQGTWTVDMTAMENASSEAKLMAAMIKEITIDEDKITFSVDIMGNKDTKEMPSSPPTATRSCSRPTTTGKRKMGRSRWTGTRSVSRPEARRLR